MLKSIIVPLIFIIFISSNWQYKGSTTAAVTLAGSILKTKNLEIETEKVPRSKCPKCKSKGEIPTGDWNHPFIPCDNCYDDKKNKDIDDIKYDPSIEVIHDPIIIQAPPPPSPSTKSSKPQTKSIINKNCPNGNCIK
jgi:hypothetical protein